MCIRECIAPDHTHELNERAVCDINMCLEQLQKRADDLNTRSEECTRIASMHALQSSREATNGGRARELALAKRQLVDRKRFRLEYARVMDSIHTMQNQVPVAIPKASSKGS